MTWEAVVPIIVAILGGAWFKTLTDVFRSRGRETVERAKIIAETGDIEFDNMSLLLEAMRQDVAYVRKERDSDRAELEVIRTEVRTVRAETQRITRALTRWTVFYEDLVANWAEHRVRDHPPDAPLEEKV